MAFSREEILAVTGLKTETVNIPEWGGDVIVRELPADEADAYSASLTVTRPDPRDPAKTIEVQDLTNYRARLVVKCVVDESGQRVFTDADAPALGAKSSSVIGKLQAVASKLSGIGDEAEAAVEGESEAAPSGGSNSTSPESSDSPPAVIS